MNNKKIYGLQLHEEISLSTCTSVMRVPGGWIYTTDYMTDDNHLSISTTFVPYNEEFHWKHDV